MSSSLRFPEPREAALAAAERRAALTAHELLADAIAPGRVLEVDGVGWQVRTREDSIGTVYAYAAIPGLLEVWVSRIRHGRALDELVDELAADLRARVEDATEGVLEVAATVRAARGE